jgi:serine-type D-Ala-D-Ala carboxypeptidase/endopeptidase
VRGCGETERGNGSTPRRHSLLGLKVFTPEVPVSLAAEGKLRLTDPLQRYASDAKVPVFRTRPITLLDLATHSAGLPREMGEAPPGAVARAWPTREDRWKWLPGYQLPWAPGTIAAYSNIAFAPGRNTGLFVAVNRVDFAMFFGLTEAANGIIATLVTR